MDQKELEKLSFEFRQFLSGPSIMPPAKTQSKVMSWVSARLRPALGPTLLKLVTIYAGAGIVVLAFCPQFGLTLLAKHGVLHWLSAFGEFVCSLLCGALFLGTGTAVACIIMTREELVRIRAGRFVYFLALSFLALFVLHGFGAQIVLWLAFFWVIGSIAAELTVFEIGYRLKCFPVQPLTR